MSGSGQGSATGERSTGRAATGGGTAVEARVGDLLDKLRGGDLRTVARAITVLERGGPAAAALAETADAEDAGEALRAGFTGPPGAGKSALLTAVAKALRARGERVAVLSVDPSSPFSAGALLGDRIRFAEHFLDQGVFVRSMATRGAYGGLAAAATPALSLLGAAGFPYTFVETVGVGQTEVDVVDAVDTVVLVLMPGSGDVVQALKAGVMEIPDIVVVNKADDPRSDGMATELRRTLRSARERDRRVPILKTQALTGEGVEELLEALAAHREQLRERGELERRRQARREREALRLALALAREELLRRMLRSEGGRRLRTELAAGKVALGEAAEQMLGAWARDFSEAPKKTANAPQRSAHYIL